MFPEIHDIFITGGTGYIGKRLVARLLEKGHRVTVLVRKGSENKVMAGARIVTGNPFDASSFVHAIPANAVYIQLLGVAHPSPKKAAQFVAIDLASAKASALAAANAKAAHIIYVSVSMEPSSIMAAYQEVRKQGERFFSQTNIPCTCIRPWYVVGPGHYWPLLLLPVYGFASLIPSMRRKATAFGLVTIRQMLDTLVKSVENKPAGIEIIDISAIRKH